MNILQNVGLAGYSTMGLGGAAAYLTAITSRAELTEAIEWAKSRQLPIIMIGGGSNIIWKDEGFNGLVLINKVPGYDQQDIDENSCSLIIGAGENWDSVVQRSVEAGFTGIEALSLIPGSAGATPIQNVGAYGQEISESLTTVEAYDTQTDQFVTLAGMDCNFSYRNSRFKTSDRGRFFILGLTLQLNKGNPGPPFYGAVQTYLEQNNISEVSPAVLRQAVIAIRTSKLPDPAKIHNAGSFFANPIIARTQFDQINDGQVVIPNWPTDDDSVKLSAAWLIEQAGFKNHHDPDTGMSTWPTQTLVLVNEKARDTADLLAYKAKIVDAVLTKFGVTLVQEPELLP
jgi:UDP-N-acetylmuramate dehydrogenase